MSLQRVAFAYLMTSTEWTPCGALASTIRSTQLIPVQLSLGAVVAHPMHQLFAAKSGGAGMNAICSIALIVPFMQQLMLCCFKCGVLFSPSRSFVATSRKSAVFPRTLCNFHSWLPSGHFHSALRLYCRRLSAPAIGILVLIPIL